ncbi:mannose-1-phosphate guanylyltransferase [Candidatus Heimdallarchaeota archaeon B3_Heim]|nr:MAG: mannose-1-phosphate guanylyltransferase [Candidatus Heimdallarchaeota archaeon B3_Heim]
MVNIVILAGGGGERLWPKSRKNKPKQCISLDRGVSLIQQTYHNACKIVDSKKIHISTRDSLKQLIREQLPDVNLIVEPLGRDSAAGIGYACSHLLNDDQNDVTIFMGADYFIPDLTKFKLAINPAVKLAEQNKIALIGIKPRRAETRFGYIEPGNRLTATTENTFEVNSFKEKPTSSTAREYIRLGYLWNSGMFIVKPSFLYLSYKKFMPTLYEGLETIRKENFDPQVAKKVFEPLSKVSIDYGIMEKSSDLVVVKGDFEWDDIGTWDSLDRIMDRDNEGNIIQSDFLGVDVKNSIIFGEKPIVGLGIEDLVIIDTNDCIFVCKKGRAHEIKKIITKLEEHPTMNKLLNYNDFSS